MNPSIPISNIVNITPAVIANGGTTATMSAVLLSTTSTYAINQYTSADAVGTVFGKSSDEYKFAVVYFGGFDNADKTPTKLYISKVNMADTNAVLIGASVASLSLSDLQKINGSLTVTVSGTAHTETVNLSTATSFSNAAELMTTAFTGTGVSFLYSSTTSSFYIVTTTTGENASLDYATGTVADTIGLSQASGAVLNNYTKEDETAEQVMKKVFDYTLDFVSIATTSDEHFTADFDKMMVAWNSTQNNNYWYVGWDMLPSATVANNASSFGGWLQSSGYSGTTALYDPSILKVALASAYPASLNFDLLNGNTTLDFRQQNGLDAGVTDKTTADNLETNGYMYYGAWATSTARFKFFRNARVSGKFLWLQKYVINLRLRARFTDVSINMFQGQRSIPYNKADPIVRAYMQDPIDEMINYGGIQAGVTLTSAEKNLINSQTGSTTAADQIFTNGWYLYIGPVSASARSARTSIPIIFYYTDGDSMQSIAMTVTNVQ